MPAQLFVFVQLEFPWALGPSDGRYLIRDGPGGEPEHVVVLETLDARRAAGAGRAAPAEIGGPAGWFVRRASRAPREREVAPEPPPAELQSTRVTVIDPVPLSAESQARAWLEGLDREREVHAAVAVANRVLDAQRIAAADAYLREVAAAQALVVRAGWGEGEQVASGLWLHARELSLRPRGRARRRDSAWALRPQERLGALLTGRNRGLLCEQLTLRARLDLDQGRDAHAAVGLERALLLAASELRAERREDLSLRIAELEQLHEGVEAQAHRVLEGARSVAGGSPDHAPDADLLEHALGRLEAALRARTATGV